MFGLQVHHQRVKDIEDAISLVLKCEQLYYGFDPSVSNPETLFTNALTALVELKKNMEVVR